MKGRFGKMVVIGLLLIGAAIAINGVLYASGVSPFNMTEIRESRSVAADGSRIEIRSEDGDVRVVVGGGEAITATVEGRTGRLHKDEIRLEVSERDGKVVIEASREAKRRLISLNPGEYRLLVELPDRRYEQVEIVTVAADITVEAVRANRFGMESVSGEIKTSGLSGSIDARTEAGDIELGVTAIEGDIFAETGLGDIEVVTEEAPEQVALDLRTLLGEQKIGLPGTEVVSPGPEMPLVRLVSKTGDIGVSAGR